MAVDVVAIFDIGKTNKKFLLFDAGLNIVFQDERKFPEIVDDDGFSCDDIDVIEQWMKSSVSEVLKKGDFNIKALNFTTYGATLMYIDEKGRRLTPAYNYLKPMPDEVMQGFYEKYGGVDEFSRKTASPALGMLNSGLQILWLKRKKPDLYKKAMHIVHLPQYLSYLFTGRVVSEYTSIGCHTAMWDFDNKKYHSWLKDESVVLPEPVPNDTVYDVSVNGHNIKAGIGIHDSSSSLVPYFVGTGEQFILISTGTWCIYMNPFNTEPLTAEQLRKDSLCYMSIQQQQVKSSRLFMGHIHDVNVERLENHFGVEPGSYKKVKTSRSRIAELSKKKGEVMFFRDNVPADYIDSSVDLSVFKSFEEAYEQLVCDLVDLGMESLKLIIPADDRTKTVYISGGFARNDLFNGLMASKLPGKKVYTSEIDNSTALGAAMVIWNSAFGEGKPPVDLGIKLIE